LSIGDVKLRQEKIQPVVLIVDDDEFNYFALKCLLKNLGYKSQYANNGKQALKIVRESFTSNHCGETFKCILMDCNMPIMDGYCATKKIN